MFQVHHPHHRFSSRTHALNPNPSLRWAKTHCAISCAPLRPPSFSPQLADVSSPSPEQCRDTHALLAWDFRVADLLERAAKKYQGGNTAVHDVRARMGVLKNHLNRSWHFNLPFTRAAPGDSHRHWPYVEDADINLACYKDTFNAPGETRSHWPYVKDLEDNDINRWSYIAFMVGLAEEAVYGACWHIERPEDFQDFYVETNKLLTALSFRPKNIDNVRATWEWVAR